MTPLTPAEKQKRYRERKAGRQPAVIKLECQACGKVHTGTRGILCCRCWERLTPEGKAYRSERVRRSQSKRTLAGDRISRDGDQVADQSND